jgi:hypothetical protein
MSTKYRRETGVGRAVVPGRSGSRNSSAAVQVGARVSASVVLVFIFASTAIALYDLTLLIKLFAR